MNVVVDDVVVVVDVFRAGSVTCQENSSLAQMRQFSIDNAIALLVQVQTYA